MVMIFTLVAIGGPHMPTGTLRYVRPGNDYGYISRDDKLPKVFVHISDVQQCGVPSLMKGQRWEFDIGVRPDGREIAVNLKLRED
ncbi:cold-shock protein [Asticcacaulis sp.]|uniref:cold-shock protein n=1 Tax=Asticcacaulis sp. TaxID=1872648 RepID=UPI00391B1854